MPKSDAEKDQSHPKAREMVVGGMIQNCFKETRDSAPKMGLLLTNTGEQRGTPGREWNLICITAIRNP